MKSKWKVWLIVALSVCLLLTTATGALAEGDADTEPTKSTIPDRLEIQLGTAWAGIEFRLETDAGVYPGTGAVGADGILRMDIGGSTVYKLSCLSTPQLIAAPAVSSSSSAEGQGALGTENPASPTADPSEQVQMVVITTEGVSDPMPYPGNPNAPQATDAAQTPAQEQNGIPPLQLVLFIGGIVLCVGGLVVLQILKRRRETEQDDEDEDY